METPTSPNRLSMPWWELTGRIAVGVPLLLQGGALLTNQMGRLGESGSFLFMAATMMLLAILFTGAGLSALAGRMLPPLLLLLFLQGALLLARFLPAAPSAASSAWSVEKVVTLMGMAWMLAWTARRWRWGGRAARWLAAPLGVGFLVLVPHTAATVANMMTPLFLPPPVAVAYAPGDHIGAVGFARSNGEIVLLEDEGTVYVVNFWATWCPPCLAELPLFLRVQEDYAGHRRVFFLAVNTEGADGEAIDSFLRDRDLGGLAVFTDPHDVQDRLGIPTIPATLVVRDGTIVAVLRGYSPDVGDRLRREIDRALAEGEVTAPQPPEGS